MTCASRGSAPGRASTGRRSSHSYSRAPHFDRYSPLLADFYSRRDDDLADFTIELTIALAWELGLTSTRFLRSSSLAVHPEQKTDRLLALLGAVGATTTSAGPSARGYIDEDQVAAAGVTLEYMAYDYPEYEQLHPPYDPHVSILDLLFMQGAEAGEHVWGRFARGGAP